MLLRLRSGQDASSRHLTKRPRLGNNIPDSVCLIGNGCRPLCVDLAMIGSRSAIGANRSYSMVMLTNKDIEAGLVCHLNPKILREDPRTETNAQMLDNIYDHSVDEVHFFVLLKHFDTRRWLCVPLFSKTDDVRKPLTEGLKGGFSDKWQGVDSFYSPWQQWLIPVSAMIDASLDEESPLGVRRSYARNTRSILRGITTFIIDNRVPFHRPNPKPKPAAVGNQSQQGSTI